MVPFFSIGFGAFICIFLGIAANGLQSSSPRVVRFATKLSSTTNSVISCEILDVCAELNDHIREIVGDGKFKGILVRENKMLNQNSMNRTGFDALKEVQIRLVQTNDNLKSNSDMIVFQLRYQYLRTDVFQNVNIGNLTTFLLPNILKSTGFYRINLQLQDGSQHLYKVKRNKDYSIMRLDHSYQASSSSKTKQTVQQEKKRNSDFSSNEEVDIAFHNNRAKSYIIPASASFLEKLGIAYRKSAARKDNSKEGQVDTNVQEAAIASTMQFKYKQINNFVQLFEQSFLSHCINRGINTSTWYNLDGIEVVDMGCGKAYLTFALHYYLRQRLLPNYPRINIQSVGIDYEPGLIHRNQETANSLGPDFSGLLFQTGKVQNAHAIVSNMSVASAQQRKNIVRILVALHACNTATDDALYFGMVERDMDIILVAPCCHKEIRPQIDRFSKRASFMGDTPKKKQVLARSLPLLESSHGNSDLWQYKNEDASDQEKTGNTARIRNNIVTDTVPSTSASQLLQPLLQHGIYRERFSEMLTDSIRAELLEIYGYRSKILEFVDKEDAGKNTLIIGTREISKESTDDDCNVHRKELLQRLFSTTMAGYGIRQQRLWQRLHDH